jgi:hypothetical protein
MSADNRKTGRKKTETVVVTLRIKEALRRRLEAAAAHNEVSVNNEIMVRLIESFDRSKNTLLLDALLAPGVGLELLRRVAIIVNVAGHDWLVPPQSHAVAEAITKLIGVLSREVRPTEDSFPNRNEKGSADQLAWVAVLTGRLDGALEAEIRSPEIEEVERQRDLTNLAKAVERKS